MVLWHVISCNIYNTTTADIPFRLMILCLWYTQPQDLKKKTACNFWFDSELKHRYWQYLIVQPSRSPPWGALLLITSPDFTYLCQPPGSGETQACVPWRPEVKSTNMHITVHTLPLTRKGSKYGMGALLAPAPSVFCVSCSPGFSSHSILPVNSRVRRQDLADLWLLTPCSWWGTDILHFYRLLCYTKSWNDLLCSSDEMSSWFICF